MVEFDKITADWARKKSEMILGVKVRKQLEKCLSTIEIAVEQNKMSCEYAGYLDNLAIIELRKRGFTAEPHSDQREGDWTKISW